MGFGSIGRGLLPLIERHIRFDPARLTVIDPSPLNRWILDERRIKFLQIALTEENYKETLAPLLKKQPGEQGMLVSLSVDASSVDLMLLCREKGILYLDTVTEPWPGFYFSKGIDPALRSNYALREVVLGHKSKSPGGTTAVSCCGANPGMVSWMVKKALLNIARDTGRQLAEPKTREQWA